MIISTQKISTAMIETSLNKLLRFYHQILFLPSTEPPILINDTGCRYTVYGFQKYFVDNYIMGLNTCPELKGIERSFKATHKGITEMEIERNNKYTIPLNTMALYVTSIQCQFFIPKRYLKEYNDRSKWVIYNHN